jgi:FemAB-related protein (PEP-CTERM system-associated)
MNANTSMVVKEMQPSDVARWDAFVMQCPQATFFHRAGWQQVLERGVGHRTHFLYAESAGQIVGVLPLAHVKSLLFGNALSSLPFCVYGGVASADDAAREALTKAACERAQQLGVDHLELRNVERQNLSWPAKSLYVTFRKTMDADPEKNMLAIPRKQRAMVRKGIDAGLVSELDDDIGRFFDAYSENVWRLGTPVFPKKYFQALRDVFGKDCEVVTITQNGQLICTVMNFYFRNEVLPYYGGGKLIARDVKGSYDFMYWEVMRRACERGVTLFDYGRSKQDTGSFSFKKNWGFEPQTLGYEYFLVKAKQMPDVNPLNPKYQLMTKTWQRLPLPLTRVLGPMVSRSLG